jgi:hypothetical protein
MGEAIMEKGILVVRVIRAQKMGQDDFIPWKRGILL